jgi:hypothetical protein
VALHAVTYPISSLTFVCCDTPEMLRLIWIEAIANSAVSAVIPTLR